jgi:peptidoglycan/LPS O-acetylase OafA/YrhL
MPYTTAVQATRSNDWNRILAPFQRITSSGRLIPEIDGFRLIAILAVFVFHLAGTVATNSPADQSSSILSGSLRQITNTFDIGVPLFFVISGYILGLPFAEAELKRGKRVNLKKYFLRRVTRLEPPYILCLLISMFIKVASGRGFLRHLSHLLASTLYLHNFVFGGQSTITAVAWSLEIEVQFYILAPLLASVFLIRHRQLRRFVLCVLILASTGISELVRGNLRFWFSLLGFLQFFLIGLLFADRYLDRSRIPSWRWDAVSAVGWPLLVLLRWKAALVSPWIVPWLILVLYQAGINGLVFRRVLAHPITSTIGGMCYSIYLFHNQLIYGFALVTRHVLPGSSYGLRLVTQFLLIAPPVLLVTATYFRFVERPCMRPDWPQAALRVLCGMPRLSGTWRGDKHELSLPARPSGEREGP